MEHIRFNLGNVLFVGVVSILFYGTVVWGAKALAGSSIPIISPLGAGAGKVLAAEPQS